MTKPDADAARARALDEIAARRRDWATVLSWLLAAGALAALTLAARSDRLDATAIGTAALASACLAGLAAAQAGVARRLGRTQAARRLALVAALIGAPALVTIAGFPLLLLWVGLFLIYAPIYGGLGYAVIGAPLAWRAAREETPPLTRCLWGAVLTNIAAAPLSLLLFAGLLGNPIGEALELTVYLHGIGCLIAPLYGLAFWAIHRRLTALGAG